MKDNTFRFLNESIYRLQNKNTSDKTAEFALYPQRRITRLYKYAAVN